jgi:hypothetical protein
MCVCIGSALPKERFVALATYRLQSPTLRAPPYSIFSGDSIPGAMWCGRAKEVADKSRYNKKR